jgi:hypothetical protein
MLRLPPTPRKDRYARSVARANRKFRKVSHHSRVMIQNNIYSLSDDPSFGGCEANLKERRFTDLKDSRIVAITGRAQNKNDYKCYRAETYYLQFSF